MQKECQLSYIMIKIHTDICQFDGKYATQININTNFLDRKLRSVTERDFRGKSKAQDI